MRNFKFIIGTFLGVLIGIFLFNILSFNSESTVPLPQSSNRILSLNPKTEVFRLSVDNTQYIVLVTSDGGTAIVKHR